MDAPLPVDLVPTWERFLESQESTDYGAVFDDSLLFPLQRRREMDKMLTVAMGICPEVYCELGADKGPGVFAWIRSMSRLRRVIACEIRGTPYSHLFEAAFPHIQFLWLPCSSYAPETVARVRDWLGSDRIDVLFIDGDKSHFDTDFDLYSPMVRPGGLCLMHDITDPAPGEAWRKCREGRRYMSIIDTTESVLAKEREWAGIPPENGHDAWLQTWCGDSAGVGAIYL